MEQHAWTVHNQLAIPSRAAAGKQVVDEILGCLQKHQWGEQELFGVHLALEEAVVNAIKHGNQYDEMKQVTVRYGISPQAVRIEIEDQGSGFNPADIPDPTDDDNLEFTSGRGIMLMRSFMSSIEFNAEGNRVIMEKHRDG